MSNIKQALESAIEAMELYQVDIDSTFIDDAINQCKAALAELEKCEPVEYEAVYKIIINWDEGGGKRSRRDLVRRIVSYYTTPQRQQPLKRITLRDEIENLWYESEGDKVNFANAIMDAMQEINK